MLLPPTQWLLLTFLMQSLYPGTLDGSMSTGCPPKLGCTPATCARTPCCPKYIHAQHTIASPRKRLKALIVGNIIASEQ